MKLFRLQETPLHEFMAKLSYEGKLKPQQREDLEEFIRTSCYKIIRYKFDKKEVTTLLSILIRLSIVFYVLFVILAFIMLPMKYLFTGKMYYSKKSLVEFMNKWKIALGL